MNSFYLPLAYIHISIGLGQNQRHAVVEAIDSKEYFCLIVSEKLIDAELIGSEGIYRHYLEKWFQRVLAFRVAFVHFSTDHFGKKNNYTALEVENPI